MTILCWNCRGLDTIAAERALLDVQKQWGPDGVFLAETHLNPVKAENLRKKLKMDRMEVQESVGASGGLLLFWCSPVVIHIRDKSKNFIDVTVGTGPDETWRFTGFYGEPKWEDKQLSWGYLRTLHLQTNLPWIVVGDFNEILYSHEKEGGAPRPMQMMQNFRDALVDCELEDMGCTGELFTWRRRRLRERLDRAVCNGQFLGLCPHVKVRNAPHSKSDHRPIFVDTEGDVAGDQHRQFQKQFEARWLQEENVMQLVTDAWERTDPLAPIAVRTASVHADMHVWDREILKAPHQHLKELKAELDMLRSGPLTDESVDRQHVLLIEIKENLEKEEIYWVQRSRANWLKFGDRNTNFFSSFASARKKRNQIRRMLGDDGIWREDNESMKSLISEYFQHLFSSEVNVPSLNILNKVKRCVTDYMNESLLAHYTEEEVKKALFSIGDLKAPGPDGFLPLFYQTH